MAEVLPFPGLRFGGEPLADVLAPPFDVISPEQQSALYERSPYNVIRLELGREADRYAEARREYTAWRQSGVLLQDAPSFYLYEQRFTPPGAAQEQARRGLIARVRLEPWSAGVVLPHEETHKKAKEDRIQLMRAIQANVSPVFGLYEDASGELPATVGPLFDRTPDADAIDDMGEGHRLWRVPGSDLDGKVAAFFEGKPLFIADGHHRYETALAFRDEMSGQHGPGPYDYVMMALVDFANPGLTVLPTHRLLADLPEAQLRKLTDEIGRYFEVVAAADNPSPKAVEAAMADAAKREGPAFVMYGLLPSGLRVVTLKDAWRGQTFDAMHSPAWNALDVSVLHAVIGTRILGLTAEDMAAQKHFRFIQSPLDAIRQVQLGEAQMALLLRGTPAVAIRDIALAHDKMPQKATYFYPKLATGMVISPLS